MTLKWCPLGGTVSPWEEQAKTWYTEPCLQTDAGVSEDLGQQLDYYVSQITKIQQEGPDLSPHWRPLRFWGIQTPPLQQDRWEGHTAFWFCKRELSPISSHVDTGQRRYLK